MSKRQHEVEDSHYGPSLHDYKPVIAASDNFNDEKFINWAFTGNYPAVEQQKDALSASRKLTFDITARSSGLAFDLSTIMLSYKCRIRNGDGSKPANNMLICPINYFGQTCIKSVEVYANDTLISPTYNYSQLAYIDALVNHNSSDRGSVLNARGFYHDFSNETDTLTEECKGAILRRNFFGSTKTAGTPPVTTFTFSDNWVNMYVPLIIDVATVEKPIVSGVRLRVEIQFHESSYILWTDENGALAKPEFQIKGAEIRIDCLQMESDFIKSTEEILQHRPIKYRYKRTEVRKFFMPAASQSFDESRLSESSTNPERVIMMLQYNDRSQNTYTLNPINFTSKFHANAGGDLGSTFTKCNLYVLGNPLSKWTLASDGEDFAQLHYNEAYRVTGGDRFNFSLPFRHFISGNYFVIFDLSKSGRVGRSGDVRQPTIDGNIALSFNFNNPVDKEIAVYVMMEYNSSFTINKNRKVQYNYQD